MMIRVVTPAIEIISNCMFCMLYFTYPKQKSREIERAQFLSLGFASLQPFMRRYYSLLSTGYGLAYQNQRAYDLRPIYATRWIGWTFAIPTLLFMCLGRLGEDEDG